MLKNKTTLFFLFSVVFLIIYSCSGSKEDKYNLLTQYDKKIITEYCDCAEPLGILLEQASKSNDSLIAMQLIDSAAALVENYTPCFEKLNTLENIGKRDEYEKQLIAYIKEKNKF